MSRQQAMVGGLIVTGSVTWFLLWAFPFFSWTTDDAFISYRFAENLAEGNGLVFNPGERVEGFSNALWTLVLSLGARFGLDPLVLSKCLASACLMLIVYVCDLVARRGDMGVVWRVGLALLITSDISLVLYSQSGLETVSFGLLLVVFAKLAADHFHSGKDQTGKLLTISFLVVVSRPEGVLFPIMFLGASLVRLIKTGASVQREQVWRWVAFAAATGGLLLVRYGYFGDILPNTYYAKPSGSFGREFPIGGIAYIDQAVRDLGYVWPALAILFAFLSKSNPWSAYRRMLGWSILPLVLFVFYAGGDWMPNSRFLVPVFPLVYVLGWSVVRDMGGRFTRYRAAAALLILGFTLLHQYTYRSSILGNRNNLPYDLMNAGDNARPMGLWLKANFEPSCELATKRIGVVPYYSELLSLDLYGLIDRDIARWIHEEGTFNNDIVGAEIAEYVLERRPDLILLHSRTREPFEPHGKQEEALSAGMGGSYELVGEYDFSASYLNRLFIRNEVVTTDELERLREDMSQGLRDISAGTQPRRRIQCLRSSTQAQLEE